MIPAQFDYAAPDSLEDAIRALSDGGPSDTRTTPTSAPWMPKPLAKAALNVASPHGVGGYVLRMPKLGAAENP